MHVRGDEKRRQANKGRQRKRHLANMARKKEGEDEDEDENSRKEEKATAALP